VTMSINKFIKASIQEEDQEPSAPSPQAESFSDFDRAYHSMLCAGCSCLCDDISYYMKEGHVTRTLNLCEVGWKRLCAVSAEDRVPPPSPSLLSDTVNQAARLLQAHPPVLVLGADNADEAAIRTSFELAGTFRGISLPWAYPGIRRFYERAKRFGWATGLLDEVRDRAESVIFWRADPLVTHHRHLSRYSLFARGRLTERGNLDRNLAAVASHETVLEPLCQQFFQLSTDQDSGLIEALAHPGGGGGFDHRDLPALARALQGSSYVALFVDPEKVTDEALDAMFRWSAKLNTEGRKRMVILPLWDAGPNIEGFCRVSLEKNATPWGGPFAKASAGTQPEDTSWEDLAGTVGSVILISSGVDASPGNVLPKSLSEKPRVVIDPFKRTPALKDQVVIPTALPGLESDGIFFRADGLPFDVHGIEVWRNHGYPTVRDVLADLMSEGR
jgi:formylmethanofuran dehydrogenase subunit B